MTKVDKLTQDFKLLDDTEKYEAMEKLIISFQPMNVCLLLRKMIDNDDDVVCKPILRRVTKYIGRLK